MGRLMALDYGKKRTGIAVSDALKIIATPLTTVDTPALRSYLKDYFQQEIVDQLIIGLPVNLDGGDTDNTKTVRDFIRLFKKDHPQIPVETVDERYTSKLAVQAIIEGGGSKKKRRDKALVDRTAAVIMLQEYMESNR